MLTYADVSDRQDQRFAFSAIREGLCARVCGNKSAHSTQNRIGVARMDPLTAVLTTHADTRTHTHTQTHKRTHTHTLVHSYEY
jgi:hypothetical protein